MSNNATIPAREVDASSFRFWLLIGYGNELCRNNICTLWNMLTQMRPLKNYRLLRRPDSSGLLAMTEYAFFRHCEACLAGRGNLGFQIFSFSEVSDINMRIKRADN